MKWYEERYVDHRDWILDHLGLLGLSANEAVLVLMIDFMNEHRMVISSESLHQRTGLSVQEVENGLSALCARQYLEIRVSNKYVYFALDGLFETDTAKEERILDSSLFDQFETEFGRTLSPTEMSKISEWNQTIDKKLILYALREASAYQALNLTYIDKILENWLKKGYTAANIEEKRNHG